MERGQRQREWRKANPERSRAYDRAQRLADPKAANERKRRWERENPDKVLAQRRRKRSQHSGLRRADRAELLAGQGGACAICRTTVPGPHGWHGDHDHATKQVRGVLCHHCNVGLGFMRDSPAHLRAAANYLERHAQLQSLM